MYKQLVVYQIKSSKIYFDHQYLFLNKVWPPSSIQHVFQEIKTFLRTALNILESLQFNEFKKFLENLCLQNKEIFENSSFLLISISAKTADVQYQQGEVILDILRRVLFSRRERGYFPQEILISSQEICVCFRALMSHFYISHKQLMTQTGSNKIIVKELKYSRDCGWPRRP